MKYIDNSDSYDIKIKPPIYKGKQLIEIPINVDCSYCEMCHNGHISFSIDGLGYIHEDFYGDYSDLEAEEWDALEEGILLHIKTLIDEKDPRLNQYNMN